MKDQYNIAILFGLIFLLFSPVSSHSQAMDYLPETEGTAWQYNTAFSDIDDEFDDEVPEEIAFRDSLVAIYTENDATVYQIISGLNEEGDSEGGYEWLVKGDAISPRIEVAEFEMPDNDDFLMLASESDNLWSLLALSDEFDPEDPPFLPMFDFDTQPGQGWEIISIEEQFEVPDEFDEGNNNDDEDIIDFIEEVGIEVVLMGRRGDPGELEIDGNSYTAETFETILNLEIELFFEGGFSINLPIFDEYTLHSYWVEGKGLAMVEADAYEIDLDLDMPEFKLAQDDELPEEIIVPGHSTHMSNFEEGDPTSAQPVVSSETPQDVRLSQNYPNPFNPATTIEYAVPEGGQVKLEIFDMTGRKITTLVDEPQQAGTYEISWDASDHSSGVYIYRLSAGDIVLSNQMTLVK